MQKERKEEGRKRKKEREGERKKEKKEGIKQVSGSNYYLSL